MDVRPKSWLDQLVGLCFGVLACALALYGAVRLMQAVWPWLAGMAAVGAVTYGGVWLVRTRYGRW